MGILCVFNMTAPSPTSEATSKDIVMHLTSEDLEKHNSKDSCWVAIHGSVYDVTGSYPVSLFTAHANPIDFLESHPGGSKVILRCAGKDATADFESVHDIELLTQTLPPSSLRGTIQPGSLSSSSSATRQHPTAKSNEVQVQVQVPALNSLINLHDFETVAQTHLSPNAWAYISSGAEDELTKRQNAKAFQKIALRPRILRRIPAVDTSATILGKTVSLPVYMSAVGIAKYAHPDGECALAAAAGHEGLAQVLANGSSFPIERVMGARTDTGPGPGPGPGQRVFQQLYVNREIGKSEEIVRRAERAGAGAIWVTVDSPVVGKREMDERLNIEMVRA